MNIHQQAYHITDQFGVKTLYCSSKAAAIQLEIDCLKESIQDALQQASDEIDEFNKRSEEQQLEIDILKTKIKESKERKGGLRHQYEDTMKELEKTKTRIISKSSRSSMISLASSNDSSSLSSSHHSVFSLRRPFLTRKVRRPRFGSGPDAIMENDQSELNLTSNTQQDLETSLSEKNTLKLKLEARDKEIAILKVAIDGNKNLMQQLLQQRKVERNNNNLNI